MPRYPHLDPLFPEDLKRIHSIRERKLYLELEYGGFPTFDAYCIGEWQRPARTINQALKRANLGSKRVKKIIRKAEAAAAATQVSPEFQARRERALRSVQGKPEVVYPSVYPNSEGVYPSPSNNSSTSREAKKQREQIDGDKPREINYGGLGTRSQTTTASSNTQPKRIPSGQVAKTKVYDEKEWDRLFKEH